MGSFGSTGTTNVGMQAINDANARLLGQADQSRGFGTNLLNLGTANTGAGSNFFRNILGGNQDATTALLQPDINRIGGAQQQQLQAASTLMPRGGGRSGTLFQLPFQGNQQIQSLFQGLRGTAAQALPQIGAGQTSAGSNLFNIGNQGLADASRGGTALADIGQKQQAQTASLLGGLGKGLFSLLTLPFGGTSALGAFGNLFKSSSAAPFGTYQGAD